MNKRKLHHLWVRLRGFSYWYFLVVCLLSGTVAVFALRSNNLTALHLRDELLNVDQQNGDTAAALNKLRGYIYSHMNTDLSGSTSVYPPIQLKYTYQRLVAAELAKVEQQNSQLYNDAQNYCEKTQPQSFYGAGRLPCIQNYLDSHSANTQAKAIPDSLYKFDFVSPVWSPDLAGWSLVFSSFFLLLFMVRLTLEFWMRFMLKQKL